MVGWLGWMGYHYNFERAHLGMCLCPTPPCSHPTTALQILIDAQGGLKVVIPEEPLENSGLLAVFVDNSNM